MRLPQCPPLEPLRHINPHLQSKPDNLAAVLQG